MLLMPEYLFFMHVKHTLWFVDYMKNETYNNACLFWCFCLVLEVHIKHFDVVFGVEKTFELIRISYVHVCILTIGYRL